ncbi:hypothetical protein KIN20_011653 [Parelaphostrongylus tenuis]|uniref:Uncharacterized protein n=1 Tax=Parelaphostrongylus tenuis TaxID=148309 RepID=A0AAD5N0G3_PARTN|nr:hypothetical protein KIN20_011653 [Parelaphostrongylus tenuis]
MDGYAIAKANRKEANGDFTCAGILKRVIVCRAKSPQAHGSNVKGYAVNVIPWSTLIPKFGNSTLRYEVSDIPEKSDSELFRTLFWHYFGQLHKLFPINVGK